MKKPAKVACKDNKSMDCGFPNHFRQVINSFYLLLSRLRPAQIQNMPKFATLLHKVTTFMCQILIKFR